jgi:Flp pilus assembly pilin Flp
MKNFIKNFLKEEEGMGTVEIVIIIGVLIAIALIFSKSIKGVVTNMLETVTKGGNDAVESAVSDGV